MEYFTRADDDLALVVRSEPKLELPFDDVRELLILVLVPLDHAASGPQGARDHHAVAGDDLPTKVRGHDVGNVVPAIHCWRGVVHAGDDDGPPRSSPGSRVRFCAIGASYWLIASWLAMTRLPTSGAS